MLTSSYKDIINSRYILTPSQLTILEVNNKNVTLIKDLLDRKLKFSDNGNEVGSINYISQSTHYFVRAKALQEESFLPDINNETAVPIRPQVFKEYNLKEGDLIISKDSNIGEAVILDKDYPNYTISGALYKLPIIIYKYYLFAFLKHSYFRKQLDLLVPKGSTIRHAKTLFLDCKIPFPTQKNADEVVKYIESLTQAIINKEKEIIRKNKLIFELIEKELMENQGKEKFKFSEPTINILIENNRINAEFYSENFCKNVFIIKNYIKGYSNVNDLDFDIKRGQNLQVSCIGKCIYSEQPRECFYSVIKPTHISVYGTSNSKEYLGTSKKLKTLKKGDIIFGAEGFEKGRSLVIVEDKNMTITNIHGITFNHKKGNMILSIYIKCFLDYLRTKGLIDIYAVGGNGGSLAMKYLNQIPFPNFHETKQQEINSLYHNSLKYNVKTNDLDNFPQEDDKWNKKAGIIELDTSLKNLKARLNEVLDEVVSGEEVIL